jgi:Sulfatase
MRDMQGVVGSHDLLLVTLDTLRYDVAAEQMAAGRTPNLARLVPDGQWERRYTPSASASAPISSEAATSTAAADHAFLSGHHAFLSGHLPTPDMPDTPGRHPRLFAAQVPGSDTADASTWVFDAPDLVTGLATAGYHTVCIGGVELVNPQHQLGSMLAGLFAESHWELSFGATEPDSLAHQLDCLATVVAAAPLDRPLMVLLDVSAVHEPNHHYLPGAEQDSRESHAAALEYVDRHMGRLFGLATVRGRPCFSVICSDHGTAYGEDGDGGDHTAYDVIRTVPYAELTVMPGEWWP